MVVLVRHVSYLSKCFQKCFERRMLRSFTIPWSIFFKKWLLKGKYFSCSFCLVTSFKWLVPSEVKGVWFPYKSYKGINFHVTSLKISELKLFRIRYSSQNSRQRITFSHESGFPTIKVHSLILFSSTKVPLKSFIEEIRFIKLQKQSRCSIKKVFLKNIYWKKPVSESASFLIKKDSQT